MASVLAHGEAPPVLDAPEHPLDFLAAYAFFLVVRNRFGAIRLSAQAPHVLFGNILDGRLRQTVARGRHTVVVAVLARAAQEFPDPLRVGEIERFGLGEFSSHHDELLDQLVLVKRQSHLHRSTINSGL